jgi:general secretion pathway protein A
MYYHHFHLKGPPFEAASPNGAVYFSPTHLQGLATLEAGLSQELRGFTLLTGEAGTGKTTLIYSLLQRDYKRVRIAHIDDPKLSFPEIMKVVLAQLNLYSTGSSKLDYLEALDKFLKLHDRDERIAIILDEAQVLSDDALEELRLLSNHVQSNDRWLQLILVGQPELAERLKTPELRALNQRISSRGVLKPLNAAQASNYVECKLSAQGSKCSAVFERGALKTLLRRSDGLPRKINTLCHSAMMAAYSADEKKVSVRTARKVAAEYHDSVSITGRRSGARLVPAVVGTALALMLLLFVYPHVSSDWELHQKASMGGTHERTARPAKPVKQVKTVEQSGVEGRPDSGGKPKVAAASVAPHPVELRVSLAPGATTTRSDSAVPATAQRPRIVPAAPVTPAVRAAAQKQSAVPAASKQRTQVTVRYGDTLEKIAIRYFGSKSGINQLVDANPQLNDINQLSVGEIIYLPAGVSAAALHDQTATAPSVSDAEDSSER